MTEVTKLISRSLHELIVDGIKYEPIPGQFFEMRLFEQNEVEEYLDRCYHVEQQTKNDEGATVPKNPYEWIPFDSDVEKQIAERLDSEEGVKFFCKLPRWFRVATPLGDYNPDWALVHEHNGKLYLVRETKSTLERDKRRESENKKVDCGKAHFEALGVPFEVATTIHGVLQ
jgi:type III restriction enzyme